MPHIIDRLPAQERRGDPTWATVFGRAGLELYDGHCFARAAGLAFYAFLTLFPALLFVVALAGVLPAQPVFDRIVAMLSPVAPNDVVAIAQQQFAQITSRTSAAVLPVSFAGAVWSMSSGMTALVDALNEAHHLVERRAWWRVRLMAIVLTLGLAAMSLLAFSLVMVEPMAAERATRWLAAGSSVMDIWNLMRWPTACAIVVLALRSTYHFAPDRTRRWAWISPGAIAATAIWLLLSLCFKEYLTHFADYQKTYGAIGGAIVTLLWFYFTGLAVLVGAHLDAGIEALSSGPDTRS